MLDMKMLPFGFFIIEQLPYDFSILIFWPALRIGRGRQKDMEEGYNGTLKKDQMD